MAKRKKARTLKAVAKLPVQVSTLKRGAKSGANVEVITGLTGGKKYLVKVSPPRGKPVLIAVHL